MNFDEITIEDCIVNYYMKEREVQIENGKVICFTEKEK